MIHMKRPVIFEALRDRIADEYGMKLVLNYTLSNGEIAVVVDCQDALDDAIRLVDNSERMRSLRLVLLLEDQSPPGKLGEIFHPPPPLADVTSSTIPEVGSRNIPSPPPGTYPVAHRLQRSGSKVSQGSQGEFVPEPSMVSHDVRVRVY